MFLSVRAPSSLYLNFCSMYFCLLLTLVKKTDFITSASLERLLLSFYSSTRFQRCCCCYFFVVSLSILDQASNYLLRLSIVKIIPKYVRFSSSLTSSRWYRSTRVRLTRIDEEGERGLNIPCVPLFNMHNRWGTDYMMFCRSWSDFIGEMEPSDWTEVEPEQGDALFLTRSASESSGQIEKRAG